MEKVGLCFGNDEILRVNAFVFMGYAQESNVDFRKTKGHFLF